MPEIAALHDAACALHRAKRDELLAQEDYRAMKAQLMAAGTLCPDEEALLASLGLPLPPAEPFESAEMTPMARSFYAESKRVDNSRLKRDLGVSLLYPGYREGLKSLLLTETVTDKR